MTNQAPKSGGSKWLMIILGVLGGLMLLSCACCIGGYFVLGWGAQAAGTALEQKVKDGSLVEMATGGQVSMGKLPASFPKDIPVYSGATILIGGAGNDGGKSAGGVTMTVKAKPQAVVDFYNKKMAAEGWEREGLTTAEHMTMMAFKKGDRKAGVMVSSGSDNETNVVLTHEEN